MSQRTNERGRILATAGAKGGTGKTTTSLTLAAAFADRGAGVLLADCDP